MIPFLEFAGGNCQDASILLELLAVTENLLGACEGATHEQNEIHISSPLETYIITC